MSMKQIFCCDSRMRQVQVVNVQTRVNAYARQFISVTDTSNNTVRNIVIVQLYLIAVMRWQKSSVDYFIQVSNGLWVEGV